MTALQTRILEIISDLQNGPNKDAFNPEITGQGVSLWAMSEFLEREGVDPIDAARECAILVDAGKLIAINPTNGIVSFRIP